jgi:thiamine kinase-like enzyme
MSEVEPRIPGDPRPDRRARARFDGKRAIGFPRLWPRSGPDRGLLRRLRRLGLAKRPVAIEPIPGGITNHNFVVRTGRQAYVARLCEERPLLGISRRNEVACQQAAAALGLAPEVVHHEPGLLLSRLVAGRTLAAADIRRPVLIARLAASLGRLHRSWDALTGEFLYFCPFQAVQTYARTAARLGADLPAEIDDLLEDARSLSRRIAPFRPVLCHNDLLPANLIDDGEHLWLVDWEYAGIGHPLFDLANLAANVALDDGQEAALLAAYRGQADPRELAELQIFRAASLLREALWATIQTVASDIDFDYRRYADEHFRAYHESRRQLAAIP